MCEQSTLTFALPAPFALQSLTLVSAGGPSGFVNCMIATTSAKIVAIAPIPAQIPCDKTQPILRPTTPCGAGEPPVGRSAGSEEFPEFDDITWRSSKSNELATAVFSVMDTSIRYQ
ncbi:hypothetical protein MMAN_09840 [Mycobacterium mantenii]|uniref:Uncharacterized protein n=1 Tax=Mycobacterium mantenii TaxID=560555 RepID=A0ABM7JMU6_MYCNT|nr:hypothetical protein MMAN_09840 [Mycobacterium mantenii]